MNTINLDPISFIASPDEKKFVLLRSKEVEDDEEFLINQAIPKIVNHNNAHEIPGVWGTLGYKSDQSIDWSGNFKCSNYGNQDFNRKSALFKEIEYLGHMYPDLNEAEEVIEKVIDLRNLDIGMPTVFEIDELPELRLDIFLSPQEGALVFYQLSRHNAGEEDIEFIQPLPTENNSTERDRLRYHFTAVPKKEIEPFNDLANKYTFSNENSDYDFIVKVLIFKRKLKGDILPKDSKQIIQLIEDQIEKTSGNLFAKKHTLLVFNPASKRFNKVKRGSINSGLKTLMLIHGTFASTKGSFGEVYDWFKELVDRNHYQQIIAFDHPTLFDDAIENTKALFEQFINFNIKAFKQPVDLIGASQGGLIAQYMANLPQQYMTVGKVMLVASANGVGYLKFAANLSKGLKIMRKVLRKIGLGQAVLISALLQHSISWVIKRKGLDMMRPQSKALNNIMFNTPAAAQTRYLPLIGNYTAKKWGGNFLEKSIDLILDKENDWVISTKNQFMVPAQYVAISGYNPGKYRDYAISSANAIHGNLLKDKDVQKTIEQFLSKASLKIEPQEINPKNYFDAHCHLFGRSVVSGRIALMLLADIADYLKADDQAKLLPPITTRADETENSSLGKILGSMLKYFIRNKDAHAMLHDLENDYHKAQAGIYRFMPLMFDLEMTFKNAYDANETSESIQLLSSSFNSEHHKLTHKIEKLIHTANNGEKVFEGSQVVNDESVKRLRKIFGVIKHFNLLDNSLEKDVKQSFHKQLEELNRLKISYGNDVFPFLATDPRRPDMGNYIDQYVGAGKTFHGIKLYTPNGYSPSDPHLFDPTYKFCNHTALYKWCEDSQTPIMAHNSDAGFATFTDKLQVFGDICSSEKNEAGEHLLVFKNKEYIHFNKNLLQGGFSAGVKERAHTLNHPDIWKKVLKRYPKLKICLAHFGGGSQQWEEAIAKLMIEYEHVYTDLSCQTDLNRLMHIKDTYFKDNTADNIKIKTKIMYGSDYFLNLLQGLRFNDYYNNFRKVFNEEELDLMKLKVPKNFLGLA